MCVADLVFAAEFHQRVPQGTLVGTMKLVLRLEFGGMLVDKFVVGGFRPVGAVPAGLKSGDACVFAGKITIRQKCTLSVVGWCP